LKKAAVDLHFGPEIRW